MIKLRDFQLIVMVKSLWGNCFSINVESLLVYLDAVKVFSQSVVDKKNIYLSFYLAYVYLSCYFLLCVYLLSIYNISIYLSSQWVACKHNIGINLPIIFIIYLCIYYLHHLNLSIHYGWLLIIYKFTAVLPIYVNISN